MDTSQYHDRIQRATQQLAQLQARELLASQRREAKTKGQAKREEMKRRQRVAELVFLAGAHVLGDEEIVGALLEHTARRNDESIREHIHATGSEKLKRH